MHTCWASCEKALRLSVSTISLVKKYDAIYKFYKYVYDIIKLIL